SIVTFTREAILSVTSLPEQSSNFTLCGIVWPDVNWLTISAVPVASAPLTLSLLAMLSSSSGESNTTRNGLNTVTVNAQLAELPQASVAVQVTVCAPGPITVPGAGVQVTVTVPLQLSVAVGFT